VYEVEFYYDENGKSEIVEMLDELGERAATSKTERINREKILVYIGVLAKHGTKVGQPIVKHIKDDIWELRPLRNRIFFFYWKDNRYILLHHFIKKTQKTPVRELNKAQNNLKNFLKRKENNEY
jgi:phage-related protein